MSDEYVVYILELNDGSLYTGITNDLDKRIKTHSAGNGSKYVKSRLPIKKIHSCSDGMSKSKALIMEYAIKKLHKDKKIESLYLEK